MQKVVNFLEQYVEWLALGLGVLFFGWVFYGNVITPPASVAIGGQTLTAGEVDQKVYETSAQALESKIHSGGSLSVVVPDARAEINAKLNPPPAEPLASTVFTSKIFTPENVGDPGMPKKQNPQPNTPQIAELPVLPAATPYGVIGGLSTMDLPPAPGAQPNPQQGSTDQLWASASFTVPLTDVAKEFQAKHIPQSMSRTSFLQVELVRQEQLPDGSWGGEKVIPAAPQTVVVQPYPPVGNKGLEIPYRQWADTAQMLIIQPPFYTIKAGTPWQVPGTPVIDPNAKPFDPAHDVARTPEQKELKKKYEQDQFKKRQEEAKNRAKSAGRSSGSRYGGRGGGAAGGGGDVANAPRPVYNQVRPNYRGTAVAGGDDAAGDAAAGDTGGYNVAQPQGLPPEVQKMLGPIGTAPFDPAVLANTTDKLLIWAHDLTVEPGKTYRYKVHYKLANPVYMANNGIAPQKLTDQFALVSKDSAWTDLIRIPATVEFFVHQGIAPSLNAAVFDLYRWHNGQLRSKTATVQVGDIIGGPDGDVDYTTGWTIVDLRSDVRSSSGYAVLMDPKGNIVRRDFSSDNADPRNKELKAQLVPVGPNGQPLATSGAGGAAGGH